MNSNQHLKVNLVLVTKADLDLGVFEEAASRLHVPMAVTACRFVWQAVGVLNHGSNPAILAVSCDSDDDDSPLTAAKSIKADPILKPIPLLVFTREMKHRRVREWYDQNICCVIRRPADPMEDSRVVWECLRFWTEVAQLPELARLVGDYSQRTIVDP